MYIIPKILVILLSDNIMGYKCICLKFKDLNINTNNGIICFFYPFLNVNY